MAVGGRFVLLILVGAVPIVAMSLAEGLGGWTLLAWLVFACLLGGADLLLAASPRTVAFSREGPARVRLTESVEVSLLVTNLGPKTLRGTIRDAWQPTAGAARSRFAAAIPAGERRRFTTTLTPFRRGERRVGQVTIRSWGPMRLWARQATLAAPGALRVLPPFHSRKHLPSRLVRLREIEGRTSMQLRGQGTEFDSLREYVRGDDVRSIDWRATARQGGAHGSGTVMVRTWRPERDRRVVIVLDAGRTSAMRVGDETRLDTGIESALLLAALATRAGDRVDVLAWNRRARARVQGASGAELLARTVDALAPVDPELIETDWSAVPAQVRAISSQKSLVVLLTTLESPTASSALLAVLPQLTRKHVVVIAGVLDPGVPDSARSRNGRSEVYRAAAAERAMIDSERVAAAARRLGADMVTATPEQLPVALTDHYLALKAAGRL